MLTSWLSWLLPTTGIDWAPEASWAAATVASLLRYAVLAGGAWLIFYRWRPRWTHARKIQPAAPAAHQVRREIGWSLLTLAVFALVALAVFAAHDHGLTRLYTPVALHGWGWFWLSVGLMLVLHDAYFYVTHRLLHTPWLLRRVHYIHHQSANPTPWAAFAFHPVEALVQIGIVPLIVFTLPVHPGALAVFLLLMTLLNVGGHLGFELYPAGWVRHRVGRWHTTSTHHNQHHQRGRGNFGLYFTHWDRWLGTLHPTYEARFDEVQARIEKRNGT